jgi:DNA-directed RNA polymerase beta subunit
MKSKILTEKSISETMEEFLGNVQISFALSFTTSSSVFLHSRRGSNMLKGGTNEKTEIGKWLDPR